MGALGVGPRAAVLDPSTVTAAPGRPWALEWTGRVDRAVRGFLDAFLSAPGPHSPRSAAVRRAGGVAVVALGSWARRELCPHSDVDLLLLHDGWPRGDLEDLVKAICYPLWDAGISLGHAVRTPKEAARAAEDRIDTATALTERRLVAGSAGLFDDLASRTRRWLQRSAGSFLSDIAAADAERHQRYGGIPGALEPELKEGVGGLRDLHSLRWAGAAVLGEGGLDPLVGARYLGASDRRDLAEAGALLLGVRCALHLVAGKAARDRLRLDLQDEVAAVLGMADGDELLRGVGLATRKIAHLHARTWPLLLADATRGRRRRRPAPERLGPDLELREGLVELVVDPQRPVSPAIGLRAIAAAAERGTVLGRGAAQQLSRLLREQPLLPWDGDARDALLRALRAGRRGLPALSDADHLGLLQAHLPEWQRVRGRPQRNPLHTYDLDTHSFHAVAWLADVARGELDELHARVWRDLERPDVVVLGTWLHDVGKAWPGDHSVAGERIARDWVARMGFDDDVGEGVGALVRHHLLIPDAATQRDIDDPAEIERVAVTVGDPQTLDGLLLLAFADCRATGPPAWSSWKDWLMTQLYLRVRAVLDAGDPGVLDRRRTPDVVVNAAARAAGLPAEQVRALLARLPDRYLLSAGPEQLAVHAQLDDDRDGGARASVRPGPADRTTVVSVVAGDRRGLVADWAGVLAGHRVEVLEARVFTSVDGVAFAWFTVRPSARTVWERVRRDLQRATAGEVDVAALVARREAARDARPPALATPIPVTVEVAPSGEVTRIHVRGPDRPGVLYRLSHALLGLGADLVGAQVSTLGPEVRDTFYVAAVPATAEPTITQRLRDVMAA